MKNFRKALLGIMVSGLALTSCGETAQKEDPKPIVDPINEPQQIIDPFKEIKGQEDDSIWEVSASVCTLDEFAAKTFEDAFKGVDGVGYKPVALLGSQVVAGLNYAFLCSTKVMSPTASPKLKVLKIFKPLGDAAPEIVSINVFDIENLIEASGEDIEEGYAGGWSVYQGEINHGVDEEKSAIFEEAMTGLLGVNYELMALLANRNDNGENYLYLARGTVTYPNATPNLYVIEVNKKDGESKASPANIKKIDLKDYIG